MAPLLVGVALAGVDAQGLQSVDGGRFPVAMDADLGVENSVAVSVAMHAGSRLAVLRGPDGDRVLLDRVTTTDLQLSMNVLGTIRAGIAFPRHRPVIFDGERLRGVAGDLAIWVVGPLAEGARSRLSLSTHLDLPLQGEPVWLGEPDPALEVLFAGETEVGRVRLIGNLGPRLTRQSRLPGLSWGNGWKYVAGARWEPWGPIGVTGELFGRAPLGLIGGAAGSYPVEVLATADLRVGPALIGFGGGTGLTRGLGSPDGRVLGRLDLRPQKRSDRDGDGIGDVLDVCPSQPEDQDGFRDQDGCPDPDNDADGVLDARDGCPNDPETANGWKDEDGCPDVPAELMVWVLPEERTPAALIVGESRITLAPGRAGRLRLDAGPVEVRVTAEGFLPARQPVVLRAEPNELTITLEPVPVGRLTLKALGADGAPLAARFTPVTVEDGAEIRGEPLEIGVDGTSLEGPVGALAGVVSARGHLPVSVDLVREAGDSERVVTLPPATLDADVAFDVDSDALTPLSRDALLAVAEHLRATPALRLLRVEGHADTDGGSAHNHDLSLRRARAVRDALIGLGVEPERLEAIGSGEAVVAERQVAFIPLIWD